jgi:hypothetical protein
MKFIVQHWGVSAVLLILIGAIILLQTEVTELKTRLSDSKAQPNKANQDLIDYDRKIAAAFEVFEKQMFGEKAVLANPLPVAFSEPGRKAEGEIYRFTSMCAQGVNRLPRVELGDLRALPAEKKQ